MEFRCIKCGEDAELLLNLGDCRTLTCKACEEEFTTDDVDETVKSLTKLLKVCQAAKLAVDAAE